VRTFPSHWPSSLIPLLGLASTFFPLHRGYSDPSDGGQLHVTTSLQGTAPYPLSRLCTGLECSSPPAVWDMYWIAGFLEDVFTLPIVRSGPPLFSSHSRPASLHE